MNKKEEQKIEKEIKAIFKKMEQVKKNGEFLFKDRTSEYWKYKNKYYSISRHHDEDGDPYCYDLDLEGVESYLKEAKEDNESEIEGAIWRVRMNSFLIKEEYENKIKLMGVKL